MGRAELERGTPENAEDTLRQALRQAESRDANGYAGTYRLRVLLAETQERLGQNSAAKRTRRNAAADLAKVREGSAGKATYRLRRFTGSGRTSSPIGLLI